MISKGHAVEVPSYKSRVGYHAMLVAGYSMIATAVLSIGNVITHDRIALNTAEDLKVTLNQIIPASTYTNDLLEDMIAVEQGEGVSPKDVYRATMGGKVTAVAFRTQSPGYSGPIKIMMAVDRNSHILGVRVLSHTETPGLGDKIEVERTDWILVFNGKSLKDPVEKKWAVKKDGGVFDQFTGATITPRRTVKAIKEGLVFFSANKLELLAPPVASEPDLVSTGAQAKGVEK